jgi:hypothetical protein
MGPKSVFAALLSAVLVAGSGVSSADEYRAGEFLGLDLSSAVLSPKRLGPDAQFAPVRVEAADRGNERKPARTERITRAKTHVARQRPEKPRGAAPTRLARPHGNPLDAQASDTRVQVWPCKSGGICSWKR